MWVRCCGDIERYDPRPLVLRDPAPLRGPLVNRLVEAERCRQVVDIVELASACAAPKAVESVKPMREVETVPPRVVVRTVHQPIYHLGTLLDVLA